MHPLEESIYRHFLFHITSSVPLTKRVEFLKEIYEESPKKGVFVEEIKKELKNPVIRKFENRLSRGGRYSLKTTRIQEYIQGRNKTIKDDLFWAYMAVNLRKEPDSLKRRMDELIALYEDMIQRIKCIRNEYLANLSREKIIQIAIEEEIDGNEIANFIIDNCLNEINPILEKSEIRQLFDPDLFGVYCIEDLVGKILSDKGLKGHILHSKGIISIIIDHADRIFDEEFDPKYAEIISLAKEAIESPKECIGEQIGEQIIRGFINSVEEFQNRLILKSKPKLIKYLERAIVELSSRGDLKKILKIREHS